MSKKTYEVNIRVRVLVEAENDREVKKVVESMDVGDLREHSSVRGVEFLSIDSILVEDGYEKPKR
jgi:hypothetical protein